MNGVLRECIKDGYVQVYLDDILIFSKNVEEHAAHLRAVLSALRAAKLYAKPSKCSFFQKRVEFRGHFVSDEGIHMDPQKVQAMKDWPAPRTRKELMSFLGLVNFYRRFVAQFAHLARPLTRLLSKTSPYVWGEEQQAAFETLKAALSSAPVLRSPDHDKPFVIHSDASELAVGAVLQQDFGDGLQPIAYHSRTYTPAEQNYPTREKEMLAIIEAAKQWRHLILGQECRVYTDHHSLRYYSTQKGPLSMRLTRWMDTLAEYNFDIEYLKGESNVVADALSRTIPESSDQQQLAALTSADADATIDAAFKAQVQQALRHDSAAKAAKAALKEGTASEYTLHDGLLYHVADDGAQSLYIPKGKSLRKTLIAECHDTACGGHFGRDKTVDRLQRQFYWPNLTESVATYVRTCPSCQLNKPRNHPRHGLLHSLPIPALSWEQVAMDYITGFPKSTTGNDAVLTIVDRLSKFALFIPCTKAITAEQTADLFHKHVHSIFGVPRKIISNRDPKFASRFWRTYQELLGTKLNMSTPFHPQTDGQSECANRVLEEYLRHYLNYEQSNWEQLLPSAQFAYNTAKHASTGYSPHYLVFGREADTPVTLLEGLGADRPESSSVAAEQLVQRLHVALNRAKENLKKAQDRQADWANSRRKHATFKRGDQVLLSNEYLETGRPSKKLDHLWSGPFLVTEVISRNAVRLALDKGMKIHDVINIGFLKHRQEDASSGRAVPRVIPRVPQYAAPQEFYDIARFIASRKSAKGATEYQIRWKGFPPNCDTWEKESTLKKDLGKKTFEEFLRLFEKRKSK